MKVRPDNKKLAIHAISYWTQLALDMDTSLSQGILHQAITAIDTESKTDEINSEFQAEALITLILLTSFLEDSELIANKIHNYVYNRQEAL